jgi:hypothetical protein
MGKDEEAHRMRLNMFKRKQPLLDSDAVASKIHPLQ